MVAVKVVTSKVSKQSLGFAYVWFEAEEDAQVAVEEMNGKVWCPMSLCGFLEEHARDSNARGSQFAQSVPCIQFFDGRYIHVAVADPESPTKQVRATPYRF